MPRRRTSLAALVAALAACCASAATAGAATDTNGCTAQSLPLGTPVEITGVEHPGILVYNSWLTMQSLGETDADTCAFNDLALVRIDPADVGKVTRRSRSGAARPAWPATALSPATRS